MKTEMKEHPSSAMLRLALIASLVAVSAIVPASAQEIVTSFSGPQGTNSALVQGTNGNLYGTSSAGGASGYGTVFMMTPAGVLTTLASFTGGINGTQPYAGLVQAGNGFLYGTASHGGTKNLGTVFRMTPAGVMTTLLSFTGPNSSRDGGVPMSGLVEATNGNLFGTTYYGGDPSVGGGSGRGTLFTMTPAGLKTTLVQLEGTNGGNPTGGLVQGQNGIFYGTTYWGGNTNLNGGSGYGSVFKMTSAGVLTTLVKFAATNGGHPCGGLVQASDGTIYGTTLWGGDLSLNGSNGFGTVFKMAPDGTLTTLVKFTGTNGSHPFAGVTLATDGNIYGTTSEGGDLSLNGGNGLGTVFMMTPAGTLTTLVTFRGTNGSLPYAGLLAASDGKLYGTTYQGGSANGGVIFRIAAATPLNIVQQPPDLTVPLGATAFFQVAATGSEPIAYQWRFNGLDRQDATNRTLAIPNAQPANEGGYSVVLSNPSGSVTSRVATLQVGGFAPAFTPSPAFQNSAVDLGNDFTFAATASGDAPLTFRWLRNGQNLDGETNATLAITAAQPSDEGDYTVIVSNALGTVLSDPVRLWVTPPVSSFIGGNFTNADGLRLPCFYVLPPGYDPGRTYPLLVWLHGSPNNESTILTNASGAPEASLPAVKVFAALGRQQIDPGILLWPTRRAGDNQWTTSYIQLMAAFLDQLPTLFSLDTNRIYLGAMSEGVHAAWDLAALRPGFFAGGRFMDGLSGTAPASALAALPLWIFHSATDVSVPVGNGRTLVRNLRLAGGKPTYTEYSTGDHVTSIITGEQTAVALDWLVAQTKAGPSSQGPRLSITNQFGGATPTTAATTVSLAGVADAVGQSFAGIIWENASLGLTNSAVGSKLWNAAGIPLLTSQPCRILVTATTVSWSPLLYGSTTFNDSLNLLSSPIHASLSAQSGGLVLNWSGGAPPFQVHRMTNLASGIWQLIETNALPPLMLAPSQPMECYRILGR